MALFVYILKKNTNLHTTGAFALNGPFKIYEQTKKNKLGIHFYFFLADFRF